ncbi:hypothetical protein H6P81_015887 [Aristolochia fimbriata]|uniref:Uncharacterized protein n=1 Tax=Aristolochia fimbriata TaxID=158543 RepID=A0AAV7E6T4_ARIFI|nr:hypothetical protein H6P81_015887 [Aristolochia fimbriata]
MKLMKDVASSLVLFSLLLLLLSLTTPGHCKSAAAMAGGECQEVLEKPVCLQERKPLPPAARAAGSPKNILDADKLRPVLRPVSRRGSSYRLRLRWIASL